MFAVQLVRKIFPLTLLAICACGTNNSNATVGSTVVRLADGAKTCPAGGQALSYGIDKNGNGTLDDAEVTGAFDVCKGAYGSLTRVANVTPGAECAEGGVVVKTGVDKNGNGALDDAEVTGQTPVCAANGNITTFIGSLNVTTAEELAHYAHVESISGNLQVNTSPGNGNVLLPALRSVGGYLSVVDMSGGGLSLAADHALGRRRPCPTPAFASFPLLQSVGSALVVSGNYTLSAPVLKSVGEYLYCYDFNAVLPALTNSGQIAGGCGNPNLFNQLLNYGSILYPSAPVYDHVTSLVGNNRYVSGGLQINGFSVSLPNVTEVGELIGYDSFATATASLPALKRLGAVSLRNSFASTPPVIDTPQLTGTLGYFLDSSRATDANLLVRMHTIGGALGVVYSRHTAIDANDLTSVATLSVRQNSVLTRFTATKLASMPTWDPNYAPFFQDGLSENFNLGCNAHNGTGGDACRSVLFESNYQLATIDLGPLTTIPGILVLANDSALDSFTSALTTVRAAVPFDVGGPVGSVDLSVYVQNTRLASLQGLSHLTSLKGRLVVLNNQALADLGGLALTGSDATCPVFYDNPSLSFCKVQKFDKAYNAACALTGTPQDYGLQDPCDANPCASGETCQVDCTNTNGYTCQQ